MKALVGVIKQEKALVGAFSMIVKTDCETDGSSVALLGCGWRRAKVADWSRDVWEGSCSQEPAAARQLGLSNIHCLPYFTSQQNAEVEKKEMQIGINIFAAASR